MGTSYDKLPLKIVCWGEHSGLLEHKNEIGVWEGWFIVPKQ